MYVLLWLFLVVSTSAIDCLERLVSDMTCYVSSGTSNPTHSLTHFQSFVVLWNQHRRRIHFWLSTINCVKCHRNSLLFCATVISLFLMDWHIHYLVIYSGDALFPLCWNLKVNLLIVILLSAKRLILNVNLFDMVQKWLYFFSVWRIRYFSTYTQALQFRGIK